MGGSLSVWGRSFPPLPTPSRLSPAYTQHYCLCSAALVPVGPPSLLTGAVCLCPLQHLCSRSAEVLHSLNGSGSQVYLTSFPQLPMMSQELIFQGACSDEYSKCSYVCIHAVSCVDSLCLVLKLFLFVLSNIRRLPFPTCDALRL